MSQKYDGKTGEGDEDAAVQRIAKVIARSGVCSRRDAERLIAEGRVALNGRRVEGPAVNVGADDIVSVDGVELPAPEAPRLWRYHKPKGRVTSHKDPEGRPTVFEALPKELPRVISVGRLDFNSEGLLLLTNDGELARHLENPKTGWVRRYRARARGRITQEALDKLSSGVEIEGVRYGPVDARLDREREGANVWVTVGLREGKNREVRRILEHVGLIVNRLIRVSFGPFQLGDLETGAVEEIKSRIVAQQLGAEASQALGFASERPRAAERVRAPERPKAPERKGAPARKSGVDAGQARAKSARANPAGGEKRVGPGKAKPTGPKRDVIWGAGKEGGKFGSRDAGKGASKGAGKGTDRGAAPAVKSGRVRGARPGAGEGGSRGKAGGRKRR